MLTREVEKRMLKCDVYWPSFVAAANHPDPRGSPMAAAGLEFRELGIGVYPVREYADRALGAIVREVEVRALPGLEDVANRLAPTFSPSSTESAYTPAAGATPPLQPLRVTQFHYQCWPDHDAPSDLPQFHRLHLAIRACQAQTPGAPGCQPPIVIHCSAGCGRTGTFITLDWMLQALQAPHLQKAAAPPSLPPSRPSENVSATTRATEGTGHHTITGWPEVPGQVTDVLKPLADERFERYRLLPPDQRAAAGNPLFDLVRYLRTQRVSMVQSTVQYLFCYRVLAELWQRGVIKLD
ncbi:hypothetical protein IWQ60_002573 [Tieghemiomyces parasiticus]|uniref:Uncharacterized protein n=1 Tax=Tieghemiomyces parasiticus TaxID=78921 RepID=A0A9W8AHR8_9FUNG|nr:hypothetical protein IWQ60_002573 [Tieghemiomyces parasiticus]